MARYTGPKSKIARKFGEPIYGPDKHLDRKNFPPGQHGLSKKRKKTSEYGVQLREKQKVKYTYGLLERQFRNFFEKASAAKGVTGLVLLQMLESRLDNVVYRLGVAPTRAAARQLVGHRHITVNGNVVNVPSFVLRPGDIIGVREKSKSLETIVECLGANRRSKLAWLEWDDTQMAGKYMSVPESSEIPEDI
jgi:small subunit ribosomal protein S4